MGATETNCQRGKVDCNSFHQWYHGSIQISYRVETEVLVKNVVIDQGSACRLLISMWVCLPEAGGERWMTSLLGLCHLSRCHIEKQSWLWQESRKSLHSRFDPSPENFHHVSGLKLITGNRLHVERKREHASHTSD